MMRRWRNNPASERGIALISVLWGILVLSLIALSVLAMARINSGLSVNMIDLARAEAAADGALYDVIRQMAASDGARNIPPKAGQRTVNFEGYGIDVKIVPERGKVDLNSADGILISAVLRYAGMSEGEANTIAAEIEQLKQVSESKPFRVISDLRQKVGLSGNIYACAASMFTVYTGKIGVDFSMATDEVKDMIRWADRERWGGRNWLETSGTSAGGLVSGATSSVLQSGSSHSGKAYTLVARINSGEGVSIQKRAVIRLTGNRSDPFWVYVWERENTSGGNCSYHD